MEQTVTFSAVITSALKRQLEQWAKDSDRTVSAELRQILAQEARRRASHPSRQEVTYQVN